MRSIGGRTKYLGNYEGHRVAFVEADRPSARLISFQAIAVVVPAVDGLKVIVKKLMADLMT